MFVATFGATYGGINQSVVSVYLWGAALYRSDLAGMQPNASTNPAFSYYNSTTPKNLLGYTEDFSNAYWAKVASTVISNIIPAPNGLMSADKIVASSAASTWHVVRVLNAFGSGPTTISVYAKAAEYSLFRVADYDNGVYYASFDLVNGTVISDTTGGTKYVSASITFAGDGWYRCSVVVDAVSASRAVGFGGYPSGATLDNFGAKFTGNDISGVYIWGAQVSDSASIDAYSPNYFAAPSSAAYYGPRRDFSPTTLACNGLLVEEQRTNLLLHSAAFDNASWVKTRTTVTANAVASPDGTVTADKLIEDASTNTHFINQSVTTTAANHTFTVFAKAAERSFVLLYHIETNSGAMFNLSNGAMTTASTVTLATSSATAVGGGWYRCAITVAATAASNGFRVYTSDNSSTFNYAGDGTSGIYLWGAQVEAGSFPTSLIPTGAATATRAADVASVSTQAFPYSSSASTLVLATTLLGTSVGNKLLELSAAKPSGSTSANGLLIYQSSNLLRLNAYVDASSVILGDATVGAVQKVGIAYDGSDNGAVRNGGTVSSVGTTVSAAATKLSIGTGFNDASVMNGHIRQITYLPRRISNAELQTRTT